jgi:adenylyl-sulfate kinase
MSLLSLSGPSESSFQSFKQPQGFTLWLTGLSGAGKSTIAHAVAAELRKRQHKIEVLDGDEIREHLSKGLGFSREDRDTNVRRIAYVATLLARNGVGVITAAISPYRSVRDELRQDVPGFLEVHVHASLTTCAARDVKGLYKKAFAGEIPQFTGVSDPYEPPLSPDLVIDTEQETVEQSVVRVLTLLNDRGYLV